jgi:methylated-DNA-[protein]-cysteine S-methyltransferase
MKDRKEPMTSLELDAVASPIGPITLVTDGERLISLDFDGFASRLQALLTKRYGPDFRLVPTADPLGASSRLRAWLDGDLAAFDGLPVEPGGTAFQRRVWQALREIPPGRTESYGRIAARLGAPNSSRAVGHANSLNPVAIVIPCHRVVGADARLTGYAGGLDRKAWLLRHEAAQ